MVDDCQIRRAFSLLLSVSLTLPALFVTQVADARVLPSMDARTPPPEAPRPPGPPSDAELEKSGARIGYIHLNARQLFDVEHDDQDSSLSRVANRLHITTREGTIEDQLLFKSGDVYRGTLLQESARILRDTRYLRDAQVRPVAY